MRLAVESFVLRERFGDKDGLTVIRDAGFDCVDYSFYWGDASFPMYTDAYRTYAEEIRAHLDQLGLVCNQAHAPFSVRYGTSMTEEDPDYRNVTRAIEAAAILGAESIVIHSIGVPEKTEDEFAYNLRYYRSLEPYAARFGILIAVENLFYRDTKRNCISGRLGRPEELNAMIRELNSPWYSVCIDVGHAAITGNEPEEMIAKTDPGILRGLHIQDTDYRDDRHLLPYLGAHNWPAIMQALKDYGYTGDFTFELTGYLKRLPAPLLPEALRFAHSVGRYLLNL